LEASGLEISICMFLFVRMGKESIGADQQACSSGESSKKEQLPLGSSQLPPPSFFW
jgi:hypothetical protein